MYKTSLFKKNYIIILLLIIFSFCFVAINIGGQGYSLDEPQTVGVARTILTFGYPSPGDGRNIFADFPSQYNKIHGMYFWTWHPWLQFYLIAPMYAFFGNNVGMLRLPFVIFGALTVGLLYIVSKDLFNNKFVALLISLQLVFLLPFFLYVRQTHYYSPTTFFSLLLLWLTFKSVKTSFNKKLFLWITIVGLLLFQSNTLVWLSDMILLFILACWKKRVSYFVLSAIQGLFGYIWFQIFQPYGGHPMDAYLGHPNLLKTIFLNLSYTNNFIFPAILGILSFFAAKKLSRIRLFYLLVTVIATKIFIYSVIVDPHGRFLVDIMPLCLLLCGFVYSFLLQARLGFLAILLFFFITTTNTLSLIPVYILNSHERIFRFYPEEFMSEFTATTQYESVQIANYISKHAHKGDIFWANMYTLPIELYTSVPTLDPMCDKQTDKFTGLSSFKDPTKVRWYFFDDYFSSSLTSTPCLGKKWEEYLTKNYTKKTFRLDAEIYRINDTDIVNRSFPPIKQPENSVIIYEKK